MYYQIFIKNPPAKSALQKTFLSCKIKMKSVFKILKQPLRAIERINNKISKILEKHQGRSPLPPKRQTYSLQLYWKWAPRGIPQAYLKQMTIIRKTLEWLLPKILFTIKIKTLFRKLEYIYRWKHCYKLKIKKKIKLWY